MNSDTTIGTSEPDYGGCSRESKIGNSDAEFLKEIRRVLGIDDIATQLPREEGDAGGSKTESQV